MIVDMVQNATKRQSKEQPKEPPALKRRGMAEPKAIGAIATGLTRKSFGRRGFSAKGLIEEWASIVGAHDASVTRPMKISFPHGGRADGVLLLKVATGAAALALQHRERLMVERINAHFGYGAVARISMVQGPLPKAAKKWSPPPLGPLAPEAERALTGRLATIEDEKLRQALERLGRRLAARSG